MTRLRPLLVILLVLLAMSAQAQDKSPNRIGIFFDPGFHEDCVLPQPGTVFEAYLVMDHLSHTQHVLSWEAKVSVDPDLQLASYEFAGPGGGSFVQAPLGDVAVTYPEPHVPPLTDELLLVTYRFLMPYGHDEDPMEFFVGPHGAPSTEFSPAYFTRMGGQEYWVPLNIVSGDPLVAVAVVNGPECTTVEVEAGTWGAVKSLYR